MKDKYYIKLTPQQQSFFRLFSDEYHFVNQTQIIYSGQIPMAAYVLVKGKIFLKDIQRRTIRTCSPYSLIGFSEIYSNSPYKYTAEIAEYSKVLVLGRSSIIEIQNSTEQRINIKQFIEAN